MPIIRPCGTRVVIAILKIPTMIVVVIAVPGQILIKEARILRHNVCGEICVIKLNTRVQYGNLYCAPNGAVPRGQGTNPRSGGCSVVEVPLIYKIDIIRGRAWL